MVNHLVRSLTRELVNLPLSALKGHCMMDKLTVISKNMADSSIEDDGETFLSVVSKDDLDFLHEIGAERRFAVGSTLFVIGEEAGRVLVVTKGRVKIAASLQDGREVVLAFRGPGEILGELGVITETPRSASVVAVDAVEALAVSAKDFRRLLERSPSVTLWILKRMVSRLLEADWVRVEFGTSDTTARVAGRLLELADQYGKPTDEGILIDLPISQEELASWVGASREAVNKAMQQLRDPGWIKTARRSIVVTDIDALRERTVLR